MSKKLFAALSLSVLLAACQGNVTTPTDDTSMDTDDGAAGIEEASSSEAMMEESSEAMMEEGAAASVSAEVDVMAE